jgi:hypothetical protein
MGRLGDLQAANVSTKNKTSKADKLKLLAQSAGGEDLQLPEIGDILTLKVLEDLQISKDGKRFVPLKVSPIVPDDNKERFQNDFGIVEGNEYKFFLPVVGRNHVISYINNVNDNIKGSLLTVGVTEWATCDPNKITARDLQGRAKSVAVISMVPFTEDGSQTLDEVEKAIIGQ